jgi:MFS family permease
MDTTISRMLKLIGVLMVSGFVIVGIISAQAASWDNTLGFMWGGLGAGVIFTLIWVVATYYMNDMLGKTRKREEVTKEHIIGASIAILALIGSIGFVAGGLSAGCAKQWGEAHQLLWSGNACGGVLSIIWCVAEYYFVDNNK